MPRLSLWRPNKTNDYKYFDRRISEMFTTGGTDVSLHKYLGPITGNVAVNATEPGYENQSIKNIQDLLFLENRDRKYDPDVYTMRTIYRINDNDFDLTQFGLFLTGDTLFMVFHLNDMVETIGRKIIVGDVLELPHLKDYYPLDDDLPSALKRYYVVQDATRAAEGIAPTWYPHLWRVKVAPLVDSQEYQDIIKTIKAGEDTDDTLKDVLSTLDTYLNINDAVVTRAEEDVPASGYDTSFIYHNALTEGGYPGDPAALDASGNVDVSSDLQDASAITTTSRSKVQGYLTGDGIMPNGQIVKAGIEFPDAPAIGDYYLRLDYKPNRLFRYDGTRWVKIEDNVRTNLTPGSDNKTQLSGFVNNNDAYYVNALAWDAILVDDPYSPNVADQTSSFTLSSKTVVTKTPFVSTHGVKTKVNQAISSTTIANVGGNISFSITSNIALGDRIEYTIYANVAPERQSLSNALRPLADN